MGHCVQEADRHGLIGTSVMHRECCPPFEHPPADVERIFRSTVLPFFTQLALPGKVKEETLRNVFLVPSTSLYVYSLCVHIRAICRVSVCIEMEREGDRRKRERERMPVLLCISPQAV